MTRFPIISDEGLADFTQRSKVPEGMDDPTLLPRDGEIALYTVSLKQIGLRLPLDPFYAIY